MTQEQAKAAGTELMAHYKALDAARLDSVAASFARARERAPVCARACLGIASHEWMPMEQTEHAWLWRCRICGETREE